MWTKEKMEKRIIRYADLVACTNAFVDTRTPGSDKKENFTLIGPGVSENPEQYVHIKEKHGFNIGGARQPAHCINSQHSHISAEVFLVHSGKWKMKFGVNANEGSIEMNVGDVISIPTLMFRGFENIGNDIGFLFAVLGNDNPGKVTWAPSVFEMAKDYGLILLENGRLIDTTLGEEIPENVALEQPPTKEEIKALATPSAEKLSKCVVQDKDIQPNKNSPLHTDGVNECAVIVPTKTKDGFTDSPIQTWWQHGFNLRKLEIAPAKQTIWHAREEEEVIFVQEGALDIYWEEQNREDKITINTGDTITVPKYLRRKFANNSLEGAQAFVVRGGDCPNMPLF